MFSTSLLFSFYLTNSSIVSVSGYGAKLHIGKPEMLITIFWMIWGYFFVRYFQTFNDYGLAFYKEKYSLLLKKRYIQSLGVDLDTISDFGFLNKMIVYVKRNNNKSEDNNWNLTIKMKDEESSLPYFIHHTTGTLSNSEVKKLRRFLRLKALVLYPHFLEYIFPFVFAITLPIWRLASLYLN